MTALNGTQTHCGGVAGGCAYCLRVNARRKCYARRAHSTSYYVLFLLIN